MKIVAFSILLFFGLSCGSKSPNIPTPTAIFPIPTEAQLKWHKMEMNAFVHFTTNTFTDKEWGYGDEDPSIFNPSEFDANQWAETLKEIGFKTLILTCKHHDGFCLWPSEHTDHSIKNSPYKNGKGDIVREVVDACLANDLKFGVYLSPWDRNHAKYGSEEYVEYYRNQMKELFSDYGDVFEMWFDGANGGDGFYGGDRETRKIDGSTYYHWPETLEMIREMQKEVIFFSDAGPGVRWVGNERGTAGKTNWNTISIDTLYAGKPGIIDLLNTGSADGTSWVPAEVDVSIRPGWFYHESEDSLVKSGEKLFEIYLTSVGRGSTLLLNIPPDRRGLLNEIDVQALRQFKAIKDKVFSTNLAKSVKISSTNQRSQESRYSTNNLTDNDFNTYWATNDEAQSAVIEVDLGETKNINYIVLQEYIALGQRVKAFEIEIEQNATWTKVAEGTTIGYKRIVEIPNFMAQKVRINIKDSKKCILLSAVEVY